MDKLLFKRILVAALTILALVYVAYLLISAQFDMYPTENAVRATVTDTIYSTGFIIRDETIIKKDNSGILSYSCANGDTVNANGEIAKVYSNETDAVRNSLADSLDKDIKALEDIQKNSETGALSLDIINNNIKNSIINYLHDTNKNDVNSSFNDADSLLSAINQRQLFTGKVSNFNKKISELKAEAEKLRSSAGNNTGTITTPKAGYFTEFCDGYENVYPYKDVSKMHLSDLKDFKKGSVPNNIAGKVVTKRQDLISGMPQLPFFLRKLQPRLFPPRFTAFLRTRQQARLLLFFAATIWTPVFFRQDRSQLKSVWVHIRDCVFQSALFTTIMSQRLHTTITEKLIKKRKRCRVFMFCTEARFSLSRFQFSMLMRIM